MNGLDGFSFDQAVRVEPGAGGGELAEDDVERIAALLQIFARDDGAYVL